MTGHIINRLTFHQDLFRSESGGKITHLDLTGVDQLTDMFFRVMIHVHHTSLFVQQLESISLQGCTHLTDQGIEWMARIFTNLTAVRTAEQTLLYCKPL